MSKRVLSMEQVLQELNKRIEDNCPADACLPSLELPPPKVHPLDVAGRNWDIRETRPENGYSAYVRRVVEEARREFYLTEAADHDEMIGTAFAHR
ncbi:MULTISPECIES: hypothetical protein [Cupriavidus]